MDYIKAQIIITSITVCVPAITTIVTSLFARRQANKHQARSDIMQLILEDHVRVMEGKIPENRQIIHEEFDAYKKNGGNSYVHQKIEEYDDWYRALLKKGAKNVNKSSRY